MNERNFALAADLVSKSYIEQAAQARKQRENLLSNLLAQRQLPEEGWDDFSIRAIISDISSMDSNNFIKNCGVGDREARVYSNLVKERHFGLAHGMGRSGDLLGEQPKAAGSSLIVKLTHYLVMDVLKLSGLSTAKDCIILPTATGMSISLTLLALRSKRPHANLVLFPRMDQKACLKSIFGAGLVPVVVENVVEGDQVRTDLDGLRREIERLGSDNILAVLSTTSCFAPRVPDKIVEIAQICKEYGIGHIVNNAYGLQSTKCSNLIVEASRLGTVDAFVQSTDKNLLVPVGGAIVATCSKDGKSFIKQISEIYPGRASITPLLDVFITLLSMGSKGYKQLLKERKELFEYFNERLSKFAEVNGERLLKTSQNPLSMAISLEKMKEEKDITFLGSMLFSRFVSGTRVVDCKSKKTINGIAFKGYEAHVDNYHTPYLTASCTIGINKEDIDTFMIRLQTVFDAHNKSQTKTE